jgi:hypothetical protein
VSIAAEAVARLIARARHHLERGERIPRPLRRELARRGVNVADLEAAAA